MKGKRSSYGMGSSQSVGPGYWRYKRGHNARGLVEHRLTISGTDRPITFRWKSRIAVISIFAAFVAGRIVVDGNKLKGISKRDGRPLVGVVRREDVGAVSHDYLLKAANDWMKYRAEHKKATAARDSK